MNSAPYGAKIAMPSISCRPRLKARPATATRLGVSKRSRKQASAVRREDGGVNGGIDTHFRGRPVSAYRREAGKARLSQNIQNQKFKIQHPAFSHKSGRWKSGWVSQGRAVVRNTCSGDFRMAAAASLQSAGEIPSCSSTAVGMRARQLQPSLLLQPVACTPAGIQSSKPGAI